MTVRHRRYPKEEFARRGDEIYERDVRPQVEADNAGKYAAIDIETGAWEMDASEIAAGDRLRLRVPDAQTWMTRIGYGYIRRFGAGRSQQNSDQNDFAQSAAYVLQKNAELYRRLA